MLFSNLFIPITKDIPSEAKIKSHQLMLRAGMIKQSSAGIYSWLPLGFKVMKKIESIVREEQNKIGAQEMLMPTIQSSEIWKESGRYDDYGEEMLRIKDRQGREMLYGPTNEELITDVFRSSVKSYKSLPQLLYHIQWKFRDEIRPRFGVMRCKEFYMKDAYSFDLTDEDAKKSYNKMFYAYLKTFSRLGLKAIPMAADTGPIGGDLSHEFIVLADTGESEIYADKKIFEIDLNKYSGTEVSLQKMREDYAKIYSVTDDKFNEKEFNEKVKKENQLKTKGIEVGHIFQLGTKYSEAMKATVLDENGKEQFMSMGCYGIGVSRIVAAAIEQNNDDNGIIWPDAIAPFQIALVPINMHKSDAVKETCEALYATLTAAGYEVLFMDEAKARLGGMLADTELLGIPHRIVIGDRGLEGGTVEYRNRRAPENQHIAMDELNDFIAENVFK